MADQGHKFDLQQMKEYFENKIPDIRLISDLTLSEADFKSLGSRLKAAFSFTDRSEGIEDIIICYLVYWVYALIYWKEDLGIHDELTDFFAGLSQHQLRHHFQMLLDAFDDYGIYKFGLEKPDDMDAETFCYMLIARHAGIPNDEKHMVFEMIDDYRNQNVSVDTMMADLYAHMPYKSRYIFSLLNERTRQNIIWEIRTIMAEISAGVNTRDEIVEKYPHTAITLIDYCFYWREGRALLEIAK